MQQSPYWATEAVIAAHFGIDQPAAKELLEAAVAKACEGEAALKKRRTKRNEVSQKLDAAKKGNLPQFGDEEVETEATIHGFQHGVLGKDLVTQIRRMAQEKKLDNATSYGKRIPAGIAESIATDLRDILKKVAN
ncbi:MAG: hypothetical protein IOC80_14800 [Rhodobacter sp.]|nr:hypothetical protein [Rhodobacter sp.]MCA3519840.1 hypothetical protein [Rhodobacter sp.]MCA3524222.1 hypothetical protein [Rhodobacter sp.]MCA3527201.1 hypothetical protein [Rhodobacter sp.]MCA3528360.1 hypothetical protein [Rhodobacter sp.]